MASEQNQGMTQAEAAFLNSWLPRLGLFAPFSGGSAAQKVFLTFQSIARIFPLLQLSLAQFGHTPLAVERLDQMQHDELGNLAKEELERYFNHYGSDKAESHGYHLLYAEILKTPRAVSSVLEIGMGTNNEDVVSNMGVNGKPGASLRAFRDFLPHALIYGADIDKRILFTEERIRTFFVDQTLPESFAELSSHLPDALDLIIDDGLHSPDANLTTLTFAMQKIKVGGWVVVEDISREALPFWQVVAALLPANYEKHIYQAMSPHVLIFGIKKVL